MVQDQLVEYISSQVKIGVSRDAIKASLVGAGWQAADVDDTFKKVDGASVSSPAATAASASAPVGGAQSAYAAKPVSSPLTTNFSASPATGAAGAGMGMGNTAKPAVSAAGAMNTMATGSGVAAKPMEPQTIRVSDLVSAADSAPATVAASPVSSAKTSGEKFFAGAKSEPAKIEPMKVSTPANVKMDAQFSAEKFVAPATKKTMGLVWGIIAVVLIVVLGGLAGYFYMQNSSLTKGNGAASADTAAQIATLTSQVAALNASNTAFSAEIASTTAANQELALELSFFTSLPLKISTSTQGTVRGMLTVGKSGTYALTTAYWAEIYVSNSKDAKVVAVLQPLVGTSTQLSGVYIPGSANMMVTAVNGTAL